MFRYFNLAAAVFALALFAYAQKQGWNLFESVATPSSGSQGSGRIYHK